MLEVEEESPRQGSLDKVYDGIWIGDGEAGKKIALGKESVKLPKIGYVLDVSDSELYSLDPKDHVAVVLKAPMSDYGTTALDKDHLTKCFSFIDKALDSKESNVLVHCFAGVNRSATMVIAWLMSHNGWSVERSLKHIRLSRKIYPFAYYGKLMAYEAKLRKDGVIEGEHGKDFKSLPVDKVADELISSYKKLFKEKRLVLLGDDNNNENKLKDPKKPVPMKRQSRLKELRP
ncbi:hypothetical protein AAMO2058_000056100 [Amorphochlora amoebiformis]